MEFKIEGLRPPSLFQRPRSASKDLARKGQEEVRSGAAGRALRRVEIIEQENKRRGGVRPCTPCVLGPLLPLCFNKWSLDQRLPGARGGRGCAPVHAGAGALGPGRTRAGGAGARDARSGSWSWVWGAEPGPAPGTLGRGDGPTGATTGCTKYLLICAPAPRAAEPGGDLRPGQWDRARRGPGRRLRGPRPARRRRRRPARPGTAPPSPPLGPCACVTPPQLRLPPPPPLSSPLPPPSPALTRRSRTCAPSGPRGAARRCEARTREGRMPYLKRESRVRARRPAPGVGRPAPSGLGPFSAPRTGLRGAPDRPSPTARRRSTCRRVCVGPVSAWGLRDGRDSGDIKRGSRLLICDKTRLSTRCPDRPQPDGKGARVCGRAGLEARGRTRSSARSRERRPGRPKQAKRRDRKSASPRDPGQGLQSTTHLRGDLDALRAAEYWFKSTI